jgi:hypothetical protein
MTKSPKTTALGVLTILGALVAAATAILDGDPATTVNFEGTFTAIAAGVGLILAKDFNVSGSKPPAQ